MRSNWGLFLSSRFEVCLFFVYDWLVIYDGRNLIVLQVYDSYHEKGFIGS